MFSKKKSYENNRQNTKPIMNRSFYIEGRAKKTIVKIYTKKQMKIKERGSQNMVHIYNPLKLYNLDTSYALVSEIE